MILNAILPIFSLIIFGYALKLFKFTNDSFWEITEKLTYFILFPALLISKLSAADITGIAVNKIIIATVLSLAAVTVLCLATRPLLNLKRTSFASVFQGSTRFNSYIGLALVSAIFGEEGLTIIIIIAAINIPLVNIICISVLQIHTENPSHKLTARHTLTNLFQFVLQISKNPLILGCLVGIFINLVNLPIPLFMVNTAQILGSIALPLGLMAVGSALKIQQISLAYKAIIVSTVFKLILYPFIAFLVAQIVDLEMQTQFILIIFAALPTATSSYILAKQLNSDYVLMARIITIETLLSCFTLLIIMNILGIA